MSESSADRVLTPKWAAAAAILAALLSLAALGVDQLLLTTASLPLLIAGYGLGAIVATVFAAVHRALRTARRSNPRFRPQPGFDRLATLATFIGLAGGLACAVFLALEVSKWQ